MNQLWLNQTREYSLIEAIKTSEWNLLNLPNSTTLVTLNHVGPFPTHLASNAFTDALKEMTALDQCYRSRRGRAITFAAGFANGRDKIEDVSSGEEEWAGLME